MTWSRLGLVVTFLFFLLTNEYYGTSAIVDVPPVVGNNSGVIIGSVYGTELFLLDKDAYSRDLKTYSFEDFFWTGSGDGDGQDESTTTSTSSPSTATTEKIFYHHHTTTKTVFSTIVLEPSPSTDYLSSDNTTTTSQTTKCSIINCQPDEDVTTTIISPTPTLDDYDDYYDVDHEFWIVTVLRTNGNKDPVILDLKNSLARLYRTAFRRQQERHLGIGRKRFKREKTNRPVKVYIHNVERNRTRDVGEEIQVLYHVSLLGKPVDAVSASQDMQLLSDEEVTRELGYPFIIKAEPYIKPYTSHRTITNTKPTTWIFIGVSIAGLLIILLLIAFLTLGLTKRNKTALESSRTISEAHRGEIFERGVDNNSFIPDVAQDHHKTKKQSPTYINFRQETDERDRGNNYKYTHDGPSRAISTSSSSSTSLDISPLMQHQASRNLPTPPKKPPRPKAALSVKRIAPELYDSDSSTSNISAFDPRDQEAGRVISPKSYLSMPSVKSFPRGSMPEPLNKVLEPVSVLHLDMPDDEDNMRIPSRVMSRSSTSVLVRHGSVGTEEDPGVIGPIVWNMHCQRLQHGVSVDEGIDDLKVASNVSRMRKRFHDLLDDTFSLFGTSRRASPIPTGGDKVGPQPIEVKSHSAAPNRNNLDEPTRPTRPKTTEFRRAPPQTPGAPKGAWASSAPSPLVRPLSADFTKTKNPLVNVDHVLAEGRFRANDPAVPLIAAIKSEIEKCSLPGSATDLRK